MKKSVILLLIIFLMSTIAISGCSEIQNKQSEVNSIPATVTWPTESSAGCGPEDDKQLTDDEIYDKYLAQYNFMVVNLVKYSDEIITVVEAEDFDNTKMEDVLISLDNLYQYMDFARELPDPIDDSTTTINEFLNEDLIKCVANVNENLSIEYKANNKIDNEKLDTVINKLRIITNIVKSEGDVVGDTKGIPENIVKTITEIRAELNK